MDRRVLREAGRLSDLHEPYVLALIVGRSGSTPRKAGGAMLRRRDGSLLGTVGGAGLEEEVKISMARAFENRAGGLCHFELGSWRPGGLDSRCGGAVDVAVEFVPPDANVLLWGAGHTGEAIAGLLDYLGYDYAVADDRAEYLAKKGFRGARHRWRCSPRDLPARLSASGEHFTHAYLLGYDAKKDEEVLARLLPEFEGRIGMIASRTKWGLTRKNLLQRGLKPGVLAKVRTPIGIPLGADTPEEIAVSVVAEIIRDMKGRAD